MTLRTEHVEEEWHRLIPSRFPTVDVFERLGRPALATLAKELESETNPRLRDRASLLSVNPGIPDSSPRLQNWNHAPFAYTNPEPSTFLPAGFGVLELVCGKRPALAWALRRREIFLERTDEPPVGLDMRLLVVPVKGDFVDLSDTTWPDDTARRDMGVELFDEGVQGILFRRPELPAVRGLAVFDQAALQRSVQSAHYRFVWDGKIVTKIYDFADGIEILRADLMAECEGLAAA